MFLSWKIWGRGGSGRKFVPPTIRGPQPEGGLSNHLVGKETFCPGSLILAFLWLNLVTWPHLIAKEAGKYIV